jgi:hypothetical protein
MGLALNGCTVSMDDVVQIALSGPRGKRLVVDVE